MMQKKINLLFTCGHSKIVTLIGTAEEIKNKEKFIIMELCPQCQAEAEAAEHKDCHLVEMPIEQYEAVYPGCKRQSVNGKAGTVKVWVPNEE